MPKRTNEFQRLVKTIYERMASPGDLVTESARLKERDAKTEREVDILLEKKMFGAQIRIAVECRDRSHKDDVTWIDGLIGKYKDLDVDRKFAVSSSGFSLAAQNKANLNRIELLTLRQALETNWAAKFVRLGMALVAREDRPDAIHIITDPAVPELFSSNTMLVTECGQQVGTVEQVARAIYERRRQEIDAEIGKQFLTWFKTLGDISSHKVTADISQPPANPIFIERSCDVRYRVVSFLIRMVCSFSYKPVTLQHYMLGEAQISVGNFSDAQNGQTISVSTIQVPEKPNQVNVHWEPKQKAKKRKKTSSFA